MLMMMRTDLEILRKINMTTPTTTLTTPIPNILTNIPTIQQNSEITTTQDQTTTQEQPTTQAQPTTENNTTIQSQGQLTTQTDITRTDAEKAFISKINKNYQFSVGFKRDASDVSIKYLQYFLKSQGFYQ